jgi:UDP-glucuronate 4-epimerase
LEEFEKEITYYEIDIADTEVVEKVFATHSFDAVCHMAAQAGVRYSIENPLAYAQANYVGTLNIFESAKHHGVKQIVAASSSSVYGLNHDMPFKEEHAVDAPASVYAATKRGTELLAHTYHHLFGLNISMLRFFTVYGPWGRPDMAPFLFTEAIVKGEPIKVFNNGDMSRDFTYIDDIVAGVIGALHHPNGFEIYNLGRGEPVALMDFIAAVEDSLGKKAVLDFQPMQPGDVVSTWADVSKAQQDFSYHPQTSIRDGVKSFVDWYRNYYRV